MKALAGSVVCSNHSDLLIACATQYHIFDAATAIFASHAFSTSGLSVRVHAQSYSGHVPFALLTSLRNAFLPDKKGVPAVPGTS